MRTVKKKVTKKKLSKKVAKKKATKKKAVKKKVKTNDDIIDQYSSRIEERLLNDSSDERKLVHALEKIKSYSLGDIVFHREYSWDGNYDYNYYDSTDIEVRHKVTYIDSLGYAHIQRIKSDGTLNPYFTSMVEEFMYALQDDFFFNNSFYIDKMFEIDDKYVDSTIMGTEYDPLSELKEFYKEEEAEQAKEEQQMELLAKEYYEIKDRRKALRIYLGGHKFNSFAKKLEPGKEIYSEHYGKLTVKHADKDKDMYVFTYGTDGLLAFDKTMLKKLVLFESEPEILPYVPDCYLNKYKPSKS